MFKINLKLLTIIFILSFIIVVAIFYNQHKNNVLIEANKRITTILNTNKALHKYVENIQKPVIYKLKKEGKLYNEFFDPKLLSFTYIARNIHKNYVDIETANKNTPYIYKLAATNPRNPVNKATAFEAEILNKFRNGEFDTFSTMLKQDGEQYFFKAMPIDKNKQSCMKCHSTPDIAPKELIDLYGSKVAFGEKVGDIRAMISLKIPVTTIIKNTLKQFYINIIVILFIFVVFYIILIALLKKDMKLNKTLIELEKSNALLSQSVEEIKVKSQELHEKDQLIAQQSKMSALGEMIGNIAHQWRQPLSVISTGATGMLLQKEVGNLTDDDIDEACKAINKHSQFLSKTIDDFGNYIKGDRKKEIFSLSDDINDFLNFVEPDIDNNKLNIILELQDDIKIEGYPNELIQCFVNIFNNSKDVLIELDEDNRYIFISTMKENDNTIIKFKDNGGGINEDILLKIFEPYFTTKHKSRGTGLGLHMTYNLIVDGMNGTVNAQNVNYTYKGKNLKGLEFIIKI